MTLSKIKNALFDCGNTVSFEYNGEKSGISPNVTNGFFTFDMWYGEQIKTYSDFEEMVNDHFFDEKSFSELLDEVDIYLW